MLVRKSFAGLIASLLALAPAAPAAALGVRISEVLYDAVGTDDGKLFVELYGTAGLDLAGLRLEGVNGADGAVAPVLTLSGVVPADGFFVVADASAGVTGVANADLLLDFDLQNGPDSVQLVDPNGAVIDAVGYGSFLATEVFAGEGLPTLDPAAGWSVARHFADVDTDDNAADFGALEVPTPGFGPTQVPEPGSALLLAAAMGGLFVLRRASVRPPWTAG
jgi:hypothetical protein